MLYMERSEIISATEIVKNFSTCRDKAKSMSRLIIFKNNKPDLALIDIDEYEKILSLLEIIDRIEDEEIIKLVEAREEKDTGIRYQHDEIESMLRERLANG